MKLLLQGDSAHTISGFGTALRNLGTYLHKVGHEVYHMGWQTFGQKMVASFHDKVLGYSFLPNVGGHRFGEVGIKYWLPRINPDALIMLADFWMIGYIFQSEISYPIVYWYPVDGYPVTDMMIEALKRMDHRICISRFGRDLIIEKGLDTSYIPHGVDISAHKPRDKSEIREMKQKIGIPLHAKVIGRVDRNQSRKKIPRTIKAYIELKKDYGDDIVLLLWMDKRDKEGWDLPFICKRLGLEEGKDFFFPPPDMLANFMYGVDVEDLSRVMGCIDIHCWLTGGEGFGLTGLETMANGAVNVATDYTTPKEIFGDWTCGLPVKVESFETGSAGVDRSLADIDHAYEQMKWLLENLDEMKVIRERGIKRAREVYDWNIIVKQFDEFLRENL